MQGRWVAIGACALALSFALAACGGGDDDGGEADPTAEFIAAADEVCAESQRERVELVDDFQLADLEASQEEVLATQAEREAALLEVREDYAPELEALEPPEDLVADWDEFLSLQEDARAAGADAVAALEDGDEPRATKAFDQVSKLTEEAHAVAEEIGLEACAQVLPPEDVGQVKATIELLEVTDDPERICAEAFTEFAIETQFGSVEECEAAQEKLDPSDFADSVEFEGEVQGVEEVYARVEATVVGGQYDGEASGYNLFYEDGAYKVGEVIAPGGG